MKFGIKTVTLAGALLAMGAGGVALSAPAQADDPGIDLQRACQVQYDDGGAWLIPAEDNVYDWSCYTPRWGYSDGIDMDAACRDQYSWATHAQFSDYWNKYSWYCV